MHFFKMSDIIKKSEACDLCQRRFCMISTSYFLLKFRKEALGMHREFLMGNEAIALGAIAAGVNFVSGYPGTPSTEILETIAKYNKDGKIYVEWSVNEKAGLETSAGASYSGARTLVTMKQVGLNVASDPLMSLAYIGV